jgi:putative transposase
LQTHHSNLLKLREHGVSKAMIYNWKAKYGGMELNDLKRIKELEEENRKLKHMYAELALDNKMLKGRPGKKVLRPAEKRLRVEHLQQTHEVSLGRACEAMDLSRSVYYYQSHRDDRVVIDKLQLMTEQRPTEEFWKMYYRLRKEGLVWNGVAFSSLHS